VVDLNTAFDQHFSDVSVGQVEAQTPPNRDDDHVRREAEPRKRGLRR